MFKLNVSFGFILRNNETGELQYYYASPNNEQVFEEPFQITTSADLPQVREALQNLDVLEWVRQRHPNSKWIVDVVTNITFFITKIRGHHIGRGKHLPHYIVENHGITPLDCDKNSYKSCNEGSINTYTVMTSSLVETPKSTSTSQVSPGMAAESGKLCTVH